MNVEFAVSVVLLLLGYAASERVLRHPVLADWTARLDAHSSPLRWLVFPAFVVAAASGSSWQQLGIDPRAGWLSASVAFVLSWNAATRDRDPVVRGPSGGMRVALVALAIASLQSPLAVVACAWLLSARFGFWQHHAAFPMRVLLLLVAHVGMAFFLRAAAGASWGELHFALERAFCVLLLTMLVSHYVITALAKVWLGPRPWSWMLDNRLHYLAASAYSWGWARFIPWTRYVHFVGALRRIEVPLQVAVFFLELATPLALVDHRLGAIVALLLAGFHVGVWLLSGLCFWDWALTDVAIALFLLGEAPPLGWPSLALGLAILVAFPLQHRLWKPMPLGWYDTPLTQRVHWFVRGTSGREYRLDNAFMCPHERLYGKVHGSFALDTEVLTYHLGECFLPELRSAIVLAGPHDDALEHVRKQFGIRPYSPALVGRHVRYLQAFFAHLNAGAAKSVLPPWARWLKAPGDQMFYWGEGERYARQEAVDLVRLVFREEYFDGTGFVRLRNQEVLAFAIPPEVPAPESTALELTPRELDDHLLALARGRLIRDGGGRDRYWSGDDARATTAAGGAATVFGGSTSPVDGVAKYPTSAPEIRRPAPSARARESA